ncbi:DNA-binding transcriptional regulator, Lrp family [Pseudonocardia ammonioxydans]|uniref:DNA-binding transcriptional regulator, Lrp family n=1 Tax=Pseudonocardia ammonioxydans TaxID=260086 RepID=A0A1I5BKY6_PSUAM|nr:Lrp/AsnC family transcriptional regulator [Pseudonocardia ammonioxydans]SFN75337.1 DNA-binding transcriptional regulator, Lrp family [Pseudonocardia ammonioxydans]
MLNKGAGDNQVEDIDDIDRALLRLLHEDGRRTFADMAAQVGLSTAATKRRVDRLRETGVITGFTVQVDHKKLGWAVEAFSEVRYAGTTNVTDIVETASRQPEVQAVYTVAGDLDALVQVRVRDLEHLQEVIDRLRRTGTITGTRTLMVLGRWTRS